MALEKHYIPEIKKDLKTVKKLADRIGCLVLINLVTAIYKANDTKKNFKDERFNVLRNHIEEVISNVDSEDEDYYKLALETLNENKSESDEKTDTKIPTLDYWMLNVISEALQKEYDYRSKDRGLTKVLSHLAEKEGLDKAKAVKSEIDSNRWDDVGQVALCMKRIEEIKEGITLAVTEA